MLGRFGKFTLVERIAEGGMAEVFKATVRGPEGFERIVAIKRLHRALCEDADLTQMLVDEARIAVQLNHPNIGNVFDLGCIENQYFIIMEYIDGTDLLHLLEQARMQGRLIPVQAALFGLSETLSGLHYAHTKLSRNGQPLGIVHRDISPQNIMITWDGRVKLVDFGIAKARNRAQTTQHGIIKGKFYYMAPEQAQGHHVDPRTDVYAAGMVLYEALAGRSPYDDVPETELLRYVRRADFPPPSAYRPDLDPELSALVEVATQRNPDKRFSNAMEFQLALNDYRHRKLGAFAEPHMARVVAQIANAAHSDDNFRPMDRGAYRPSEESLLFEQPSPAELAAAAGGSDIGRGRDDNPFGDDLPTEIYDQNAHRGQNPRLDLPPSPGRRGGQHMGAEGQTHGELPSHNGFQSQRPFAPSPPPQLGNARARRQTKPSIVDRVAKPKYVYMAIAFAVVLVCGLGFALMSTRTPEADAETEQPEAIGTDPTAAADEGEKKVAVAFVSEPPNAQVFLNDVDKGTTPLSLELEVGKSFRVEFVKDGFEIDRQEIVVAEDETEVTAELAQARGILKINSFPPDAVIFIEEEEQGATPLHLTGMETDQTYEITARLGEREMTKKVEWKEDSDDPIQEVMFEFTKGGDGAQVTLKLDNLPDSIDEPKKRSTRKKQFKRKRPRRRKTTRSRPRVEKSDDDDSLNVFGSASSSSSSSDDDDDDLNVFGSSSKKSARSEPEKEEDPEEDLNVFGSSSKTSSKKAEPKKEDDADEDLDVFGSAKKPAKKAAPKKKAPAKKKKTKKKDADEDLDIWGKPKKKSSSSSKKEKKDDDLGDIW